MLSACPRIGCLFGSRLAINIVSAVSLSAEETFQWPAEGKNHDECRITSEDFEDTTVDCNIRWQRCLKRAQRLQKEKAAKDIEYDTGEHNLGQQDGKVGGVCPTDKHPEIQPEVLSICPAEVQGDNFSVQP